MNVTKAVVVHHTVDVLPTPQSPRPDPFAGAPTPQHPPARYGEDTPATKPSDADGAASSKSSTESRPRWLRKVRAWLDGRWGAGHKRKPS